MQNIRNMIHLLEMQNEDTKFFYEIEFMLKNKSVNGVKKNLFSLKFIFLTPLVDFFFDFILGHFPENDTYMIFLI